MLRGGKFDYLDAGIFSRRTNFVAPRLDGTENCSQKPGSPGDVGQGERTRGRIVYGRSDDRGKAKRTICGHRHYRTARHQRECLTNPGQDRALSLRCIHEEALLRRDPLEDWIPSCGTSGARLGGEELSASFAERCPLIHLNRIQFGKRSSVSLASGTIRG